MIVKPVVLRRRGILPEASIIGEYSKRGILMLILASASPRRAEILSMLGYEFDIIPAHCDENIDGLSAAEGVGELARRKAQAVADLYPHRAVLGSDTLVAVEGKVLGKPASEDEARTMLSALSGSEHTVVTGVTLRSVDKERTFSSSSNVRFAELNHEQIDYYINKYHPMDKAGAYGIQEWIGYVGIESIEGSFYNVMGLPVQRLCKELECFVEALPSCYL